MHTFFTYLIISDGTSGWGRRGRERGDSKPFRLPSANSQQRDARKGSEGKKKEEGEGKKGIFYAGGCAGGGRKGGKKKRKGEGEAGQNHDNYYLFFHFSLTVAGRKEEGRPRERREKKGGKRREGKRDSSHLIF